jgi:lipid-binding SYLF domain-containing protein
MKKKNHYMIVAAFLVTAALTASTALAADDLASESQQAIAAFQSKDSTLKTFFDKAEGYAVFPNIAKGGLIVGGAHGDGLVYQKGSVIGSASVSQASIGAQVGGQAFAEVIFFETTTALEEFKLGKFEMSAEVSAVAAAEGAAKAAKYTQGIAVFSMPKKGLMAQASIGGQKFKFKPNAPAKPGTSQEKEKGKQ